MSVAHPIDRSPGRQVVDSVFKAVAAPLSFIDQSGSYTRHLERALLAEGKRRLHECLGQALAVDVAHLRTPSGNTLQASFARLEGHYRRWLHDVIERALDFAGIADGEQRRPYALRARRFIAAYQTVLDQEPMVRGTPDAVAGTGTLIFTIPECLAALLEVQTFLRAGTTRYGVDGVEDDAIRAAVHALALEVTARLVQLWHDAIGGQGVGWSLSGGTSQSSGPGVPASPALGDRSPVSSAVFEAARGNALAPRERRDWLKDVEGGIRQQSGTQSAIPDEPLRRVGEVLERLTDEEHPSAPDLSAMTYAWTLLFPHQPWFDAKYGHGGASALMPRDALVELRQAVLDSFRGLDEHDEAEHAYPGRLPRVDRAALRPLFEEIIERSPEPVPFDHLFKLLNDELPAERRYGPSEVDVVRPHLQVVLERFNLVIHQFEAEYRRGLARSLDDEGADGAVGPARLDFGWGRLWPAVWSDDALELWTEREERGGGASLPITWRLVFNRKADGQRIDSVMLVPLFPLQRTFEAAPLRELVDYMHGGAVAILPNDSRATRTPYRLAALAAIGVHAARFVARAVWLVGRLAYHRLRSTRAAVPESERLEIWNRGVADFLRLGSQRHGPLDQARAWALRRLPDVLGGLTETVELCRERLVLALTPIPFPMLCDTLRLLRQRDRDHAHANRGEAHEWVSERLDQLYPAARRPVLDACAHLSSAAWGLLAHHRHAGPGTPDEQTAGERVARLELFLLAALYFRAARRNPRRVVPGRLDPWLDAADVFALVADARRTNARGRKLRACIIARLVLAAGDPSASGAGLEALTKTVQDLLDKQPLESEPRRRPAVEDLIDEALRRCSPATYVTLRDVFWDHITWPLPDKPKSASGGTS